MVSDLNNYKNKIKVMFLSNQILLKLINENNTNPLLSSNIKNPYLLFEKSGITNQTPSPKILFKDKNFDLMEDVETFILVDILEYPLSGSLAFNNIEIIFRVITHNSLLELADGSDRISKIKSEIDKVLIGNVNYGTSKIKCKGVRKLLINGDYVGRTLIYSFTDRSFNYHNESGD